MNTHSLLRRDAVAWVRRDAVFLLVTLATAAALGVDAYVHLTDAADYDAVRTSVLTQAGLFRAEGLVAAAIAVLLLARPKPLSWVFAATVLVAGFGAVVLYTYVDVGRIGPVPNMYEPSWALPGKVASAWAEGAGACLSGIGGVLARTRRHAR